MLLKEFFSNPKKLKIFHGGENDIRWLKMDFDIDVFNVFDTNRAELLI